MPGCKYFRVCLGSDGCLVNSYCFVKRYERVTAASVPVSVSYEAMPSFIYPLDEGCYLSTRSYKCYCVRHTIFNPQAIMTSLSQSVHWRHPPALLWCQLKYRSCMERCLVMLRGSVGQFYTRGSYVGKPLRFQDDSQQILRRKGAQTSSDKWSTLFRSWLTWTHNVARSFEW